MRMSRKRNGWCEFSALCHRTCPNCAKQPVLSNKRNRLNREEGGTKTSQALDIVVRRVDAPPGIDCYATDRKAEDPRPPCLSSRHRKNVAPLQAALYVSDRDTLRAFVPPESVLSLEVSPHGARGGWRRSEALRGSHPQTRIRLPGRTRPARRSTGSWSPGGSPGRHALPFKTRIPIRPTLRDSWAQLPCGSERAAEGRPPALPNPMRTGTPRA